MFDTYKYKKLHQFKSFISIKPNIQIPFKNLKNLTCASTEDIDMHTRMYLTITPQSRHSC